MEYYSPALFRALNGVFCVYKPANKSNRQIIEAIKINLARELNKKFICRPPRLREVIENENVNRISDVLISNHSELQLESSEKIMIKNVNRNNFVSDNNSDIDSNQLSVDIEPPEKKEVQLNDLNIVKVPDLSDHVLVVGPRYLKEDFEICSASSLNHFSSGVTLFGIGNGVSIVKPIVGARYMRVYHVKGRLGLATQDFTPTGRVIEQSTYGHVSKERLDRVISGIQAGHQRNMFGAAGVDLQSEEAYNLACKGLLRPTDPGYGPVLYGLKCIDFKKPEFTIEIHAINETCGYIMKLIHDIGLELRTNAVCTQLRRIRYGLFTLKHALLFPKHTTATYIIDNICTNRLLLDNVYHTPNITNLPESHFTDEDSNLQNSELDIKYQLNTNLLEYSTDIKT